VRARIRAPRVFSAHRVMAFGKKADAKTSDSKGADGDGVAEKPSPFAAMEPVMLQMGEAWKQSTTTVKAELWPRQRLKGMQLWKFSVDHPSPDEVDETTGARKKLQGDAGFGLSLDGVSGKKQLRARVRVRDIGSVSLLPETVFQVRKTIPLDARGNLFLDVRAELPWKNRGATFGGTEGNNLYPSPRLFIHLFNSGRGVQLSSKGLVYDKHKMLFGEETGLPPGVTVQGRVNMELKTPTNWSYGREIKAPSCDWVARDTLLSELEELRAEKLRQSLSRTSVYTSHGSYNDLGMAADGGAAGRDSPGKGASKASSDTARRKHVIEAYDRGNKVEFNVNVLSIKAEIDHSKGMDGIISMATGKKEPDT